VSSAAHVACAALGDVRQEHRKAAVPPNATFEVRFCLASSKLCESAIATDLASVGWLLSSGQLHVRANRTDERTPVRAACFWRM
jgi:hypothetical protein